MQRLLLLGGMATPALGVGMIALAEFLTPGHDLVFDLPSQFGMAGAAHPEAFNGPLLAIAILCLLCAPALAGGLVRNGAHAAPSGLAALSVALVAVYLAMVASYPVPNPLHGGFRLGVAGHALPILGAFALRGTGRGHRRQWLLVAISAAATAMGVAGKAYSLCAAEPCPLGLQVELFALAYFVSVSVLCHAVLPARVRPGAAAAPPVARSRTGVAWMPRMTRPATAIDAVS